MHKWTHLSQWISNKPVQNFVFLFAIQFSNILFSFIAIPIVTGHVGAEQFGLINLAFSIITLVNVAVAYGYQLSGPKDVAVNLDNRHTLSSIFSQIIFSKVLIAILVIAGLIVSTLYFQEDDKLVLILLFSIPLVLAEAIFPSWLAQGLQRLRLISVGNLVSRFLYLCMVYILIKSPQDAYKVNFLLGGSALVVNACMLIFIVLRWDIKFVRVKLSNILDSWRSNFYLFLSTFAAQIAVSSGIILLSFFASGPVLGIYSLAERVSMILRMFPVLITQAIYPNAGRLFEHNRQEFYLFLKKAYVGALLVSIGVTAVTYVFAPIIVAYLSKGFFDDSVFILRILSPIPFLACLNIANHIIILVTDSRKTLFHATWIFSCYMLSSCTLLTMYFGKTGLAFGVVTTELVIFVINFLLIYKKEKQTILEFYRYILFR